MRQHLLRLCSRFSWTTDHREVQLELGLRRSSGSEGERIPAKTAARNPGEERANIVIGQVRTVLPHFW